MKKLTQDQKTDLIKQIHQQVIELTSKIFMGEITSIDEAQKIMYEEDDVIAHFFKAHLDITINQRNFFYVAGGFRTIQRELLEEMQQLLTPGIKP